MRFFEAFGAHLKAIFALPRGRDRLATVIAWMAGIAGLIALVHRCRFGPDITDESFALAMPYRFVQGDKPFVDEISIQQTSALVLYPFVWLWVKVTGGTTYIFLFVRLLHLFAFKGAAALAVYAVGRRILKHRASAIAMAFLPFAYVHHSIPNLGYNIIGMSLLTAATFLAVLATSGTESNLKWLFCAGYLLGVVGFAYPPMIIAALVATPIVLATAPSRRFVATGAFIAGGLTFVVCLLPMLRHGGVAGIQRALNWGIHSQQVHDMARLMKVPHTLWDKAPNLYFWAFALTLLAAVTRLRAVAVVVVPAVILYLIFWNREESTGPYGALHCVIYVGLFTPALFLLAKPDRLTVRAVVLICIPSFAAGWAAGYTSTQGPDASSLGLHASAVLGVMLAVRALENTKVDTAFAILPPIAMMYVLTMHFYDFVYRDAPMAQLTETIKEGPFKGIRTNPDRAAAFAELSQIVKTYDQPKGRMLVLYESSGYYLFSTDRAGAHCSWEVPYGDTDGVLAYWQAHITGHGYVLVAKGTGHGVLDPILTAPERLLTQTPHFAVYRDR